MATRTPEKPRQQKPGLELPLADGVRMEIEEFLKLVGSSPEVDALLKEQSRKGPGTNPKGAAA